ncbi:ArsR/SmtB family transcription factor [Abyssisolibacter fermentans]|uniref:ArsR/SmtB family transcription factor n=1 Tax=Abyssisolibacter fermentans TaxID=1766203 RepID=UPI00082DF919|nr:metalloregulator ArsR/SmtB family transcription factor [Abyssisolibacter fermentans]
MVQLFKVLGDKNRLRILNLLIHAELCVCEIEVILEMTQSNVSRHLSKLRSVNLICPSKDAQWVHYKISSTVEKENEFIIKFLRQKFKTEDVYISDIKRYLKYKSSNLNCQMIREDKNKVLKIIKED